MNNGELKMTELETLTTKLEELGFSYEIKSYKCMSNKINLEVEVKSKALEHHFLFKNDHYVIGNTGTNDKDDIEHKTLDDAIKFIELVEPERSLEPYSKWRHFKGTIAEVITVCKHSETGEELVVYRCTGNHGQTNHSDGVYARPKEMFLSEVDHEKYPDVKQKYRLVKIARY